MKSIESVRRRLDRNNPSAPPDRRYRLAIEYFRRDLCVSMHDDEDTREIVRFLRQREALRDPDRAVKFTPKQQALSVALDLHHGDLECLRPVLEAYLLTELSDSAIADKFGWSVETVRAYRRTFFDVDHLRNYPARIVHQVIRIVDPGGRTNLDAHRIWKLVAYRYKSKVLEQLLGIDGQTMLTAGGDALLWLTMETQTLVRFKMLLAAGILNPEDPGQVNALLKFASYDQRSGKDRDEPEFTLIESHFKAMLEDIPWALGDEAEKMLEGTKVGQYDELPAELRDDELQKTSAGEDVPGLEEELNIKMPPPRKRKPTLDPFGQSLNFGPQK